MAEFSSSPEARALARLKELHHAEEAPPGFRRLVARRLVRLEAPTPEGAPSRRVCIGLSLLAAAAAVLLAVRSERTRIVLVQEPPVATPAAELVSLRAATVPGSLRWRGGAAADGSGQLDCQYLFSVEPEGSAPIRVRWTQCEFPGELREATQRRSSAVSGPLRVLVTGRWSAPGELDAMQLRVLPPASP